MTSRRRAKLMAGLREDYAELGNRLVPFAAAEGGVASRIKELREARDRLTVDIGFSAADAPKVRSPNGYRNSRTTRKCSTAACPT